MESATTPDSDDDSDATRPPEETPERETQTRQEADATNLTREEKPEQPAETPQRSTSADVRVSQDVAVLKPDDGCATPPPPPAHDSEVSNDNGSSPRREKPKPPAGATGKRSDMAAAKSALLAFRSFSWDKKGRKSEAPPDGCVPSTGEHRRPADGKAWEEAAAEHKEKGKARWKRLWK
jgi:hypothetical protein